MITEAAKVPSGIDPNVDSVPIWLVWGITTDGGWLLRAVCLTKERADRYLGQLQQYRPIRIERYVVEPSFGNHMYGGRFEGR